MFVLTAIITVLSRDAVAAGVSSTWSQVAPRDTKPPVGFFDVDNYDSSGLCYEQFMTSQDKNAWATCCTKNPSSANCLHYKPQDVCYNWMEVGDEAVSSGRDGEYPNDKWEACCNEHCDEHDICDESDYCYLSLDAYEYLNKDFPDWAIGLIIAASVAVLIAILVVVLCCKGVIKPCWKRTSRSKGIIESSGSDASELNVDYVEAQQIPKLATITVGSSHSSLGVSAKNRSIHHHDDDASSGINMNRVIKVGSSDSGEF